MPSDSNPSAAFLKLKEIVARDDFDVDPKGDSVFYSNDIGPNGEKRNRDRAVAHAKGQSKAGKPTKTLEQTPGGEWLDSQDLFGENSPVDDDAEALEIWKDASKKYAQRARGSVRCFVIGAKPESVFRTVEFETLLNNREVKDINGLPREKLAAVYARDPELACKLVQAADDALRNDISIEPINTALSAQAPGASSGGGGGGGGPPAARITDMHVCPMVTGIVPHVGGPIITGMPTVLTGSMPQARITDLAVCVGPLDIIIKASSTVLVGGLPAARIGDQTVHGGVIVTGYPTVLIGG